MSEYTPFEEEQGRIAKEILESACERKSKREAQHTPTPEEIDQWEASKAEVEIILGKSWNFIVRAVNSHRALLDTLKQAIVNCKECRVTKSCERCELSRKAIAQAEGQVRP